jgi:hypothetical protein
MREVAIHESGHSVVARVLGLSAGRATLCDHDGVARAYFSNGGGIASVLAILAGRAATEVLLRCADDYGCSGDDAKALELLMAGGFIEREPRYARIVRRQCLDDAKCLIRKHRAAVERVAGNLLLNGTLSAGEIDRLMVDGPFNSTMI